MSEQSNVLQLKMLATKITSTTKIADIPGYTIAEVLEYINANLTVGSGGGKTIENFVLCPDENNIIQSGALIYSDGTSTPLEIVFPDDLALTSDEGSGINLTVITVTPSLEEGHHYKVMTQTSTIKKPAKYTDVSSWTDWDGASEITATKGNYLAVAECNEANQLLKIGTVKVVAPLF